MEIFINELSLPPHETPPPEEEAHIINALISTLKTINTLNKNKQPNYLLENADIFELTTPFICQKSLQQLQQELPREERVIILSFMDKIKILSSTPTDSHIEQLSRRQTTAFSSYINEATKSLSICLASSALWDHPEIHFESTNSHTTETITNLTNPNLSELTSATSKMYPLLKLFASSHASTRGEILPNAQISNHLLQDKAFSLAFKKAQNLPARERIAAYNIVGSAVAEINLYNHNTNLSTVNSTKTKIRKIFTNPKTGIHISIDFMHGSFEVHKSNGEHIKEITFTGEDMSPRDAKGKHNIRTR